MLFGSLMLVLCTGFAILSPLQFKKVAFVLRVRSDKEDQVLLLCLCLGYIRGHELNFRTGQSKIVEGGKLISTIPPFGCQSVPICLTILLRLLCFREMRVKRRTERVTNRNQKGTTFFTYKNHQFKCLFDWSWGQLNPPDRAAQLELRRRHFYWTHL